MLGTRERASGTRLLVVDALEAQQREQRLALVAAGVDVVWSTSGCTGLVQFGREAPDAVVVAAALPDLEPDAVVTAIRGFGDVPVLLGVGPGDAESAGRALLAGATGAVSRPYSAAQVVERLVQVLPGPREGRVLRFGPLVLDPGARAVRLDGTELNGLPHKEFELLRLLMQRGDQIVHTDQIRATLWPGQPTPSSNAVAVHVARLRHRVSPTLALRMVRGVGYRLTLSCPSDPAPAGRPGPAEPDAAGEPDGSRVVAPVGAQRL